MVPSASPGYLIALIGKLIIVPLYASVYNIFLSATYDTLGTQTLRLHKFGPNKFPSSLCSICQANATEELYHFTVGCERKWRLWVDITLNLGINNKFPDGLTIWAGLVSLNQVDAARTGKVKQLENQHLVLLGTIFSAIWKYHWHCVLNNEPCISTAVYQRFHSDHQKGIQAYKSWLADNTTTDTTF
ncbi:hypothetical protein BD770DRAFT_428558 [Pilaira anomala]|nr:hypothetical protein BD770DRAFT_428558 [Pilaira anomala]